jgi:phosphate transport system substrate-binding protein
MLKRCSILALTILTATALAEDLPAYVPTPHITGTIRTWGSPQMAPLLHQYETSFHSFQPNIRFDDDLRSTLTAAPAVYTGRADLGLLGRELWPTEQQAFLAATGHAPVLVDIATGAFDVPKATFALMVFVHTTNPLTNITTAQLAHILTSTSPTWADTGLTGPQSNHPIHLYSFAEDNDKAIVLRALLFPTAHWSPTLHEFTNAGTTDAGELILRALAADPDGLAVSNIHYATASTHALSINSIAPTRANVATRAYPLTRSVYLVLDEHPSPALTEFLRYVLSRNAATDVLAEGEYLPLPAAIAAAQRSALHLDTGPHP